MRRAALALLLAAACASAPRSHERTALTGCTSTAGTIVCNGYRFAQVLCVNAGRRTEPEAPAENGNTCRALGVRYFDDEEVVWLYRAHDFDPSHPEDQSAGPDLHYAYDVSISASEGKVRYQLRTIPLKGPSTKDYSYDLFAGLLGHD